MTETFLHSRKKSLIILFIIYVISFLFLKFIDYNSLSIAYLLIILSFPYIIPFVIVGGHYNKQKYLDPVWVKIVFFIIFAIYIALSTSWSSSMVNKSFSVPSSNFPITTALINIAYLPYNFFGILLNNLFLLSMLIVPFLVVLFPLMKKATIVKYSICTIFFCFYIGSSMSSVGFLIKNNDILIKKLAVNLDFDSKNNCLIFNQDNYKVVHIGDGKIMVFDSNLPIDSKDQFKISQCFIVN